MNVCIARKNKCPRDVQIVIWQIKFYISNLIWSIKAYIQDLKMFDAR